MRKGNPIRSTLQRRRNCLVTTLGVVFVAGCAPENSDLVMVGTVERTLLEMAAPAAETIIGIAVERGDRVAPGDIIVQLDATLAVADLAGAESVLAGARTSASVARADYERVRKLARRNVASAQEVDHAALARDQADAELRAAGARLVAAQKRLRDLTLTAPVSGVVDQLPFDVGERVPAGAVLAVLLADGAPWVRVWLPERGYARVGPGTPAEIRIDGLPAPIQGQIWDVASEPEFTPHFSLTERERVHLVYETRVRIDGDHPPIRPGAPAEVRIRLDGDAGAGEAPR